MFKNDLFLRKRVMNAAGMLGFAPDPRSALHAFPTGSWEDLGAFVTNPLSMRPRLPTTNPELVEYPGVLLLHTGLPNPGIQSAIQKYTQRWATAKLPVIIHLMADRPEETVRMVRSLEGLENIAAIELGFAPLLSPDIILMALELSLGELPLVINLPYDQVLSLGPRLIQAGAAALSFAAPHGSLPGLFCPPAEHPAAITGRLYGPALFPQSFEMLRRAVLLGLPIIAGGGIYTQDQADAMFASGALAVQLDTVLWK